MVYTCSIHSLEVGTVVVVYTYHCRDAQPRSSEDQCHAIFDKGQRIEQEFAEFFTGKILPACFYFYHLSSIINNLHINTCT